MTTHGAAAKSAREAKAAHPEDYCDAPRCLWRTYSVRNGATPCPRHQADAARAMRQHADAAEADAHASYITAIEGGTR